MAHPLFWQQNTTGSFTRGKVGGFVKVTFTGGAIAEERDGDCPGFLAFSAQAKPAACSIWVPMGMAMGVAFTPAGIWLPRSSPIQCNKMHSGGNPCQNKPVFSR